MFPQTNDQNPYRYHLNCKDKTFLHYSQALRSYSTTRRVFAQKASRSLHNKPKMSDQRYTKLTQIRMSRRSLKLACTPMTKTLSFVSLMALILIITRFYIANPWRPPFINSTTNGLWLHDVLKDEKFARQVQSVLGDVMTKELVYRLTHPEKSILHKNQSAVKLNEGDVADQPPIYLVTPTYRRPDQMAQLTRLAQTLMHVANIYWLLVEDAPVKSPMIEAKLKKWGIRSIHMNDYSAHEGEHKNDKCCGVGCRNLVIRWIRENANDGVLYFADDDNTYDIELFKEIRSTKKVAMWPVGLVTQTGVSTPIVKNGKFVGFYDGWIGGRKFPVDMAGFAVNIQFLKQRPKAQMAYYIGYEEDSFLKSLAPFEPDQIELKADNCTKLLVWHTQARKYPSPQPLDKNKYADTNLVQLENILV